MCIIKALQMLFILRGKRDLVVQEICTYIGIPYHMDRTFLNQLLTFLQFINTVICLGIRRTYVPFTEKMLISELYIVLFS